MKYRVFEAAWLGLGRMSPSNHNNFLRPRKDCVHVNARAPGTIDRTDGVGIPAQTPGLVRSVMRDKSKASAESILRSDTAHSDMEGMVGKKILGTVQERFEG